MLYMHIVFLCDAFMHQPCIEKLGCVKITECYVTGGVFEYFFLVLCQCYPRILSSYVMPLCISYAQKNWVVLKITECYITRGVFEYFFSCVSMLSMHILFLCDAFMHQLCIEKLGCHVLKSLNVI